MRLSALSALALLALPALAACDTCPNPGETCQPAPTPCPTCPPAAPPDYPTWLAALPSPANPPAPLPPQYDTGGLGIKGLSGGTPNVDLGVVWSWPGKEGYEMSKLRDYGTSLEQTIAETSATPPGSEADFKAMMSTAACKPWMDACVALAEYKYDPLPPASAFPPANPPGVMASVIDLGSVQTINCGTVNATTATVRAGWIYRSRAVVDGQVKWLEEWFINSTRKAPDQCPASPPPGAVSIEETHQIGSTTPPGQRAFVDQLTDPTTCTAAPNTEPWCGFCKTNTCEYVKVELEWWKKQ